MSVEQALSLTAFGQGRDRCEGRLSDLDRDVVVRDDVVEPTGGALPTAVRADDDIALTVAGVVERCRLRGSGPGADRCQEQQVRTGEWAPRDQRSTCPSVSSLDDPDLVARECSPPVEADQAVPQSYAVWFSLIVIAARG